jgi:hypothetical protein
MRHLGRFEDFAPFNTAQADAELSGKKRIPPHDPHNLESDRR